jgi:hypothetical protein
MAAPKVDFIVQYGRQLVFLECKDFDNPGNPKADPSAGKGLSRTAHSGEYVLVKIVPKLDGTITLLSHGGHLPAKPDVVRFVLLVECARLTVPDLQVVADQLDRVCHVAGPPGKAWADVPASFEVEPGPMEQAVPRHTRVTQERRHHFPHGLTHAPALLISRLSVGWASKGSPQ